MQQQSLILWAADPLAAQKNPEPVSSGQPPLLLTRSCQSDLFEKIAYGLLEPVPNENLFLMSWGGDAACLIIRIRISRAQGRTLANFQSETRVSS